MRWERLFDDLEGQADAAEHEELMAEVAERTRAELTAVFLADRLRAALGSTIRVQLVGGQVVTGQVRHAAPDSVIVIERNANALVRLAAVAEIAGLGTSSAGPQCVVAERLALGHQLRAIARDRAVVRLSLIDSRTWSGALDRVGADFVDVRPADGPGERVVRTVPFSALAVIRFG